MSWAKDLPTGNGRRATFTEYTEDQILGLRSTSNDSKGTRTPRNRSQRITPRQILNFPLSHFFSPWISIRWTTRAMPRQRTKHRNYLMLTGALQHSSLAADEDPRRSAVHLAMSKIRCELRCASGGAESPYFVVPIQSVGQRIDSGDNLLSHGGLLYKGQCPVVCCAVSEAKLPRINEL